MMKNNLDDSKYKEVSFTVFSWSKWIVQICILLVALICFELFGVKHPATILIAIANVVFFFGVLPAISTDNIISQFESVENYYNTLGSNTFYAAKYILCNQLDLLVKIPDEDFRSKILVKLFYDINEKKSDFDGFNSFERINDSTREFLLKFCDDIIKDLNNSESLLDPEDLSYKLEFYDSITYQKRIIEKVKEELKSYALI